MVGKIPCACAKLWLLQVRCLIKTLGIGHGIFSATCYALKDGLLFHQFAAEKMPTAAPVVENFQLFRQFADNAKAFSNVRLRRQNASAKRDTS